VVAFRALGLQVREDFSAVREAFFDLQAGEGFFFVIFFGLAFEGARGVGTKFSFAPGAASGEAEVGEAGRGP
jgi:hypothetical protein